MKGLGRWIGGKVDPAFFGTRDADRQIKGLCSRNENALRDSGCRGTYNVSVCVDGGGVGNWY